VGPVLEVGQLLIQYKFKSKNVFHGGRVFKYKNNFDLFDSAVKMVPWFVLFFAVTCGIGYIEHQKNPEKQDTTQQLGTPEEQAKFMMKNMSWGMF